VKKDDFNDLMTSIHQMGEIMKGKKLPGMRITYREKPATSKEVKELRRELHLTQEGLARVVGESPSAVKHWEQGIRRPSGSASKLIRVLKTHPELVTEMA
jgi:putative transcriptional regulator